MFKQLKLAIGAALTSTLIACAGSATQLKNQNDRSCSVLNEGNAYYSAKNFAAAIEVYKKIEAEEIENSGICSGSIYATLATIYTYYGDEATSSDPVKANTFYKTASRYNLKFAIAEASRLRRYEPKGPK